MNLVRAWSSFWFRPTSGGPLGLFRILVGLIALAHIGLLANESDYWLSDKGIYQGTEARDIAGPLRPSPLQYVQDPLTVSLFLGASAFVAVLFTVGFKTLITSILLYLAVLSIQHRNIQSHAGPDSLLLIYLFYLMFSQCGSAFSIDGLLAARNRGTLAEPIIVPWPQRLIQLQIVLIYFLTAIWKVHGTTWLDGTALHIVLTNGEFSRFPDTILPRYPIIINLLTHGALLIEFLLPALVWFRATRVPVLVLGVMLHGGIMLTMNINLFSELMMASYLTFLSPEEFQSLLKPFRLSFWVSAKPGETSSDQTDLDPAEQSSEVSEALRIDRATSNETAGVGL